MRYFPSDFPKVARGLMAAFAGLNVLGLAACSTAPMPEPRYPIYMQNRPATPTATMAPIYDTPPPPVYNTTAVPPVGEVYSSDLPPPPPPPVYTQPAYSQPSVIRPANMTPAPLTRPTAAQPAAQVSAGTGYAYAYVMQPHDTLFGVSRRFGVPVQAIFEANALTVNSAVSVGQRVLLPSNARDNGPEERASGQGLVRVAASRPQTPAPVVVEQPVERPTPPPVQQPTPTPSTPSKILKPQEVAALGRGMFIWPVRGPTLVRYGQLGPNVRNDGINIGAARGSNVVAAAEGYVLIVLTNSNQTAKDLGNTVYIQNGNGWYTGYSHLDTVAVKQNQRVKQGQVIGTVGQTGAVITPQLHFEIRYTPSKEIAKPIDPNLVLPSLR